MSSMFGAGRKLAWLASLGLGVLALSAVACSEGSESNAGTGGTGGSEEEGTGGTATTGGASGETGGDGTTGGQTGTGGDGEEVLFAFDNDRAGWELSTWEEPGCELSGTGGAGGGSVPAGVAGAAGAAGATTGAAGATTGAAGATAQATTCDGPWNLFRTTQFSWTSNQGKPDTGALELVIPFTDYKQAATIEYKYDVPKDFSGKMLTLQAQLASGFNPDPSFPGGLQFFVKTGEDWVYGEAEWANITVSGTWVEYSFVLDEAKTYDTDNPEDTAFDPTAVMSIGIGFNTGDGAKPDAANQPTGKPTEATFYVDTITVKPVE